MKPYSPRAYRSAHAILFPAGHLFAVLNSPALGESLRDELAAEGVAPEEVMRFSGEIGARVLNGGWCAFPPRSVRFAVYGPHARRLMETYADAAREGRSVVGVPASDPRLRHEVCDQIRRHVGRSVGYFSPGGSIELLDS